MFIHARNQSIGQQHSGQRGSSSGIYLVIFEPQTSSSGIARATRRGHEATKPSYHLKKAASHLVYRIISCRGPRSSLEKDRFFVKDRHNVDAERQGFDKEDPASWSSEE